MSEEKLNTDQMMNILDKCYDVVLKGTKITKSPEELAQDYLSKKKTKKAAIKSFINYQTAKCTTSGFLTSLGGLILLPVEIPANVSSVIYVQLQMIATIATICGYDPKNDQVQTLVYVCLAGMSATDIIKVTGIKIGNKATTVALKKLPGAVLTKINRAVGFRLVTKFGTKGVINLVKLVPVAGGVIGGGVDFVGTKAIGKRAYKLFYEDEIE